MKEIPTQMIPIGQIEPNKGQIEGLPKNPRLIRDEHFKKLKKSIEDNPEMLYLRELLVYPHQGKYVVIGGNMRLMAMRDLGYTEAPCKVIPEDTTVEQLKAYTIKDNSSFGEFDWDLLANEWDYDLLDGWCIDIPDIEKKNPTGEAKEDDFDPDAKVETVCKRGDIWQLGNHRLMCGDSTDPECFAKLMNGERADVAFTSPPYNMAVSQMSDKCPNRAMHNGQAYNEYDDNKSDADYTKLLEGALANCLAHADDAMFNIGILKASKMGIITMMHDFKDKFCDIIVWNKSQSMPLGLPSHAGCVSHRCELIFCFNQDGSRAFSHPQWSHGAQINRIDTENASNNEFAKVHAATFPVALPAEVIKAYTKTSVLDCFGGTGTTLVAAEQLGRKCYMMELDPHYCDVIIARWDKLTGNKAERVQLE